MINAQTNRIFYIFPANGGKNNRVKCVFFPEKASISQRQHHGGQEAGTCLELKSPGTVRGKDPWEEGRARKLRSSWKKDPCGEIQDFSPQNT
jgi:hypothetical protein